jgi:hypothetical protein
MNEEEKYSEEDLHALSRGELDEVAEAEFQLDANEYSNKKDIIAAILEAQAMREVEEASEEVIADESDETSTELVVAGRVGDVVDLADRQTDGPVIWAVDVRDVGPALIPEDEHIMLNAESWVILGDDGLGEIPDWAVGAPAAVIDFPVSRKLGENGEVLYEYVAPDAKVIVRDRIQGSVFSVTLDQVQKLSINGGRTGVVNFP